MTQTKEAVVNAEDLKSVLWQTVIGIRDKRLNPDSANAIAKNANAIISTVKLQFEIAKNYHLRNVGIRDFVESDASLITPLLPDTETQTNKLLKSSGVQPKTR